MSEHNSVHLPWLKIGEACELFGMTLRAIRFYEERGLIAARRDALNHRSYDPIARRRLARIAQLRAAGLGLHDIHEVLAAEEQEGNLARAIDKLHRRRSALREDLLRIEQSIAALSSEARHDHGTPERRRATA